MVRSRWSQAVLLGCGLLVAAAVAVPSVSQEPLPDLSIREVTLEPSASVTKGDVVRVTATVLLEGGPLPVNARLELSWRRLDKQEPCGITVEAVAGDQAGSGEAIVEVWIDTNDLLDGQYEIVALVDPENWIVESDETNNRRVTTLQVLAPRPELHPVELEATPASPLPWGETATLTGVVENTGRLASGAFRVEFSLFPISCVDVETEEAWRIAAAPDDSGASTSGEWIFQPADPPLGYTVSDFAARVEAVPADAWIPFGAVGIPGLERDQSVEVEAPFWTGQALREMLSGSGSTVPASAMVPLSDEQMDRLEGCITTYAVRVAVGRPEGTQEQDGTNNVLLAAMTVRPSTLELPELLPVQVTFDEGLPLAWDKDMDVEVVVMNRGGSAAPIVPNTLGIDLSFYYRARGDAEWIPLDTLTISRLGIEEDSNTATEETTIDARPDRLDLVPGSYELRVVVDEADRVPEQNEENNELIVGFSVMGTELHPISLDASSEPIRQGDTITVVAVIENTGDRSQYDFNVGFYLDDSRFDTFYYRASTATDEGLEEDDRARVEGVLSTFDFPPGTYTLRVVVDPDDRVAELDEGNNVISSSLRILPPAERLAELHVTEVELEPASPIGPHEAVTVSATVRNAGRIDSERFQVEFLLAYSEDGNEWGPADLVWNTEEPAGVGALSAAGLARSAKRVVRQTTAPAEWPEGRYRLTVRVDPSDEVPELDETNNETVVFFAVGDVLRFEDDSGVVVPTDAPNLACREILVSPGTSVDVGTTLQIRGSVANLGRRPAGSFRVDFEWIDPFGVAHRLETQTVNGLAVGQSVPLAYSVDTSQFPAGSYRAVIVVDADDEVAEGNEGDNVCSSTVQIGPFGEGYPFRPDLVPVAVRFDSSGAPLGDDNAVQQNQRLYAYVTVRNDGNVASPPFAVAFRTSLGVATEQWTGVGPLDQAEVSYPLPTGTAGTFVLSVEVDPDDLIPEEDETNNGVPNVHVPTAPSYTVIGLAPPRPQAVVPPSGAPSAVRWLAADESSGAVYAASIDGRVRRIDSDGTVEETASVTGAVADVAWSLEGTPCAYVLTAAGGFVRIDLETGASAGGAALDRSPVALVLGDGGRVYAAVEDGFHELALSGSTYAVSRLVPVPGRVVDIRYDGSRQLIYVLSTAGLRAYNATLSAQCVFDEAETVGTPAALALGGSGSYVGTTAGSGGILYALSHCTARGSAEGQILAGWRYPRTGTLPGAITSVVIDPRDIDPIYVATEAGGLYSLGFDGTAHWIYEAGAAIRSTPSADRRTGRLFFGDDAGVPHVLTLDGDEAFEIDLDGYTAGAIRSALVLIETRERTELGTRLIRNYYYGTEDGAVYKIASEQ